MLGGAGDRLGEALETVVAVAVAGAESVDHDLVGAGKVAERGEAL